MLKYAPDCVFGCRIILAFCHLTKKVTTLIPYQDQGCDVVEMRGVEPLSENPSNEPSPSAVRGLISFYGRPRTNCRKSSFMITDTSAKLS